MARVEPRRRRAAWVLGACALLPAWGASSAGADEWTVAKPKSAGTGSPITLKRDPTDAARLPSLRFETVQKSVWPAKKREVALDFTARVSPAGVDDQHRPRVHLAADVEKVAVDGDDLAPRMRAAGVDLSVLSSIDEHGYVADGVVKGAERLGTLDRFLQSAPAWALPRLPDKPVRTGDAWDLSIPYFLWSVNQPGAAPAEGFVTQVLEAIEAHDGVRCARVRTVASLRRPQPKGMTPPGVEIGEGDALARFHAEGTSWIEVDGGRLREDVLDVKMRIENVQTKTWMEWTFHRTAKPPPAGTAPRTVDWSAHMGALKFVVGYEPGMEEAWAAGRPAMLFFTSATDPWCPKFAARTWNDKEVLRKVEAYLPVLVDGDREPELRKKYEVLLLPAVVWVDADGQRVFIVSGDAPLELFRTVVETAQARAPETKPSPDYAAVTKAAEAMRAAMKSGDVRAALRAIHEIDEVKRPRAIVAEAAALERDLAKRGGEELAKAKELIEQGKREEAKSALRKLKETFGDHPVGREAWTLLRRLEEESGK